MSLPVLGNKANSGVKAGVSSFSYDHIVATGTNRILVVAVQTRDGAVTVSGVTYNGVALTKATSQYEPNWSTYVGTEIWYLVNPDEGTHSVAVTLSATSDHASAISSDWSNVDQTNPINAVGGGYGTAVSGTTNHKLTLTIDETVLINSLYSKGTPASIADATDQTNLYELGVNAGDDCSLAGYRFDTSKMGFTDSGTSDFAHAIVALKPATLSDFRIENQTVDSERTSVSSVTLSHVVGSGSNRILVVTVKSRDNSSATDLPITGITYNGVALTKIRSDMTGDPNRVRTEIWYLVDPASGTHDVVVSFTGTVDRTVVSAYSMQGAKTTGVPDANAGSASAGTSVTTNITTVADGAIIIDALYTKDLVSPEPEGTQIRREAVNVNSNDDRTAGSTKKKATAGATSMSWTWTNSDDYAHSVASFAPSTGTPANDTRPFKLTGTDTANDSRNFKTTGKETANDSRPFKLTGTENLNDSRNFKITGKLDDNSERPFKTTGQDSANDTRNLKLTGTDTANDSRPFKATGAEGANDSRNFKLTGTDTSSDSRPFKLSGGIIEVDSRQFKTTGTDTASDDRPFKLTGALGDTSERNLKLTGIETLGDSRPFKVTGVDSAFDSIQMKVTGQDTSNDARNFKLAGTDSASDTRPFKLTGAEVNAVPENVILVYAGTNASIPDGYVRETTMDDKYPKGTANATNPNTTGGALTHSHTSPAHSHPLDAHTHTVSLNASTAGGNSTGSTSSGGPSSNHGHASVSSGAVVGGGLSSVTSTYDAVNHEPPFYTVIFIRSLGTHAVPNGAITLWDYISGNIPTDWFDCDGNNGTPNLHDKFLKGATTDADAGTTGGASTHNSHVINHSHVESSHTHARVQSGSYTATTDFETASGTADSVQSHSHDIDLDANTIGIAGGNPSSTTATNNEPVHTKLMAIMNGTGATSRPNNIIGMWLGTLATIPDGWVLCDGTNDTIDMRDQHLKIGTSAQVGDTGGANTHTHSDSHGHTGGNHTHTATVEVQGATNNLLNSGNSLPKPHGHTANVGTTSANFGSVATTADSSDNQPPFRTVAFIKFRGNPANDERNFKLTGQDLANDSRPFKTTGQDFANDARNFKLTGYDTIQESRNFKVTGTDTASSERGFKMRGIIGWTKQVKPSLPTWTKEEKPDVLIWTKGEKPDAPTWTKEPKLGAF